MRGSSCARIVLAALGMLLPRAGGAEILHLTEAEMSPDAKPASWERTDLARRWAGPGETEDLERWYRFSAELATGELNAVLLPDVAMNAEVFWNGTRLGDGGRFDDPIAQNFGRPLLFPIPAALIAEGGNVLWVRVVTAPHFYGWLGPIEVGPEAELRPRFESEMLWRLALPRATTVLCAVVVALLGAFWLASRDPVYAWFALATGCWMVGNLNLHVRDLPLPTMVWARVVQLAVAATGAAFPVYAHRLLGLRRPRFERALLAYAIAIAALAALVPDAAFLTTFTALHLVAIGLALYSLATIAVGFRSLSRSEVALFFASFAVLLSLAAHDTLLQFGAQEGTPRFWSPLAAPVFIFSFATTLTLRFVRAFRRAERQNEELESRVREKRAELESNFARLRKLQAERVLGEERARMMREMHDGLGGRLIETLAHVESGEAEPTEVADAIRSSLDEMRLLVDSLDPGVDDLGSLLGTLRGRLEPSLRRRGISLAWKVDELPATPRLGPQEFLHVLRIVQEALTNVARHAGATRVEVRAAPEGGGVRIEIEDDGRGHTYDFAPGRGVVNMRHRATALGGSFALERAPTGTRISVWLPVHAA